MSQSEAEQLQTWLAQSLGCEVINIERQPRWRPSWIVTCTKEGLDDARSAGQTAAVRKLLYRWCWYQTQLIEGLAHGQMWNLRFQPIDELLRRVTADA